MAHFEGKYEVEFKYRLLSKTKLLAKLHQRSIEVMLEDNIEHDCCFDFTDNSLKAQSKSVCIRQMSPSRIEPVNNSVLTVK